MKCPRIYILKCFYFYKTFHFTPFRFHTEFLQKSHHFTRFNLTWHYQLKCNKIIFSCTSISYVGAIYKYKRIYVINEEKNFPPSLFSYLLYINKLYNYIFCRIYRIPVQIYMQVNTGWIKTEELIKEIEK